jgi:hypothetical protein
LGSSTGASHPLAGTVSHPIGANNPDRLLALAAAKTQFGGAEQAIDDQEVLVDPAVGDLRFAIGADDE